MKLEMKSFFINLEYKIDPFSSESDKTVSDFLDKYIAQFGRQPIEKYFFHSPENL